MPTYLSKWPDETAFMAVLAAIGTLVTVIMSESGQSAAMTGAVATALLSVGRFVYAFVAPNPTRVEEVASVMEHTNPPPDAIVLTDDPEKPSDGI